VIRNNSDGKPVKIISLTNSPDCSLLTTFPPAFSSHHAFQVSREQNTGIFHSIPPLVPKIQVTTTNEGARAQGGLTPDFLALSGCGFSCQDRAFNSPLGLARLSAATPNYFFIPRTASFAALATRNLTTVLAGILIFCLRLWVEARARLSLLLYQLAKARQNEFSVLFDLFVREVAERLQKYSSGFFIGLCCFGKSELKFCFCHL
jgi:type IV secretory pathway TrbD component